MATDAHNMIDRKPKMKIAYKNISMKLNPETAQMVCIENPIRLLKAEKLHPFRYNQNMGLFKCRKNCR